MKAIILIGYMCAGKTTIGKELGKQLNRKFYDLDWYIETRFRTRVADLFSNEGELAFRQKERNMLREVAEFQNIVLSCGGGTPCHFDNMDFMSRVGTVFYLKASPETILSHLKISKGKRPLLENKKPDELREFVKTQLLEREKFYEKAHHTVNIDYLDSPEKIQHVIDNIMLLL